MAPLKILVVGGGLGGSLLANGLLNNGIDATLYERDEKNSEKEGYQIRVGESGLIGLRKCLESSHLQAILSRFGRSTDGSSTAPVLYNSRFQPLLDLSSLPAYSKTSAINRVVLRDMLIARVQERDCVRFSKSFVSCDVAQDVDGREKVLVMFADGSSETCDILIGADGSSSKINSQVGLSNLVQIDSHWGFLKKGSLPVERLKLLPKKLQDGPILVFSGGAVMFYALYLPTSRETDTNKTTGEMDYDAEAASYYWALNIPKSSTKFKNPSEIGDKLKFCLDFTSTWAPEFRSMLAIGERDTDTSDVMVIPLRASTKPSRRWRRNIVTTAPGDRRRGSPRVWLLGDAIHAMQPNRGQGGNQAMHDCAEMLDALLSLQALSETGSSPTTKQIERALAEYESKMIDRAFYWVKASGGASVPSWDLDGYAGTLIYVLGWVFLPIARILYGIIYGKSKEGA